MDHDLKDFLKLHSRDGATTGPLCARALKRIDVLEAALTPFALFSLRARDDEAVLRQSDFEHARVALTGHLSRNSLVHTNRRPCALNFSA